MSSLPSQGIRENLSRLMRLIRKELSESLRDRRTILTLVLMPLLLYPVLAMAFQQLILSSKVDKLKPRYRIAFATTEEADSVATLWAIGREQLVGRHRQGQPSNQNEVLTPYLDPLPELVIFTSTNLLEDVREDRVDVAVKLNPPGGFLPDLRQLLLVDMELIYRQASTTSRDAVRHLEQLTADANAALVTRRLAQMRVKQRGDAIRVHALEVPDQSGKRSSLVPVLVPLILILMTMTGAVYPAIDLTAGERERGTLEVLVAAPIPRLSVLLAKYVAVLTVAMLTALVNLGTMVLTLQVTGIGTAIFGVGLSAGVIFQVLALLLLFAAFFSAVLLTLTSFARSFKEAQAYLIPLMLFCLTPGIMALLPGLSLSGPLAVVPLVNIVLLSRDVLDASANPMIAGIVVLVTLLYALAAIAVAARVFGTEAVLSSETSGWSDVFRRPLTPRPAAEPAGALLCLALLFPIYFLVTTGLARIEALDLQARLLLASLINLVLFAGVPLLACWFGRVQSVSGLRLRWPGFAPLLVALLLGVSLWPFVHELVLLFRQMGLATLRQEHLDRISGLLAQWRELPPALLVLTMAILPAVVEELFFRGYLLTALLGDDNRASRAVIGSSALFAIFHLLVSDALAIERLLPSFLLGLVLGGLAYRSGSVFPGMLLHLLHNSLVVLLGYYEPWLVDQGYLSQGQEHYPLGLLGGAALLAIPALLALRMLPRRT